MKSPEFPNHEVTSEFKYSYHIIYDKACVLAGVLFLNYCIYLR